MICLIYMLYHLIDKNTISHSCFCMPTIFEYIIVDDTEFRGFIDFQSC